MGAFQEIMPAFKAAARPRRLEEDEERRLPDSTLRLAQQRHSTTPPVVEARAKKRPSRVNRRKEALVVAVEVEA